jgi:hypothetical protein
MSFFLVLFFASIVHLGRGDYNPLVPLLTLLFLFWGWASLLDLRFERLERIAERALPWVPLYFAFLIAAFPNLASVVPSARTLERGIRIIYLISIFALTVFREKMGENRRFVLQGFISLGLYLSVMFLSPDPFIDVFRSNRQAVQAFLSGLNPYTQSYPDIYQGAYGYTPGFAYWPAILYLQSLSQFLFRDIRVLLVVFWWSVPFLFRARSRPLGLIWWSLPFLPFGFEQAWIDPALSSFFALLLWSHLRGGRILPLFFASLAAATKQYGGLIGFSFSIYLFRRERLKIACLQVLILFGFFLIWVLPLVLPSPSAFKAMTIDSHLLAAVRTDALSFTAFWFKLTGNLLSGKVQLIAVLSGLSMGVTHVLLRYRSRGLRVVPEASAMIFGFSMLFGKFAFCNYHWLLISFVILSEWLRCGAQSFTKEATWGNFDRS